MNLSSKATLNKAEQSIHAISSYGRCQSCGHCNERPGMARFCYTFNTIELSNQWYFSHRDTHETNPVLTQNKEEDCCEVCISTKKDHLLVPCGHMCYCEGCSASVQSDHRKDRKKCPIWNNECPDYESTRESPISNNKCFNYTK